MEIINHIPVILNPDVIVQRLFPAQRERKLQEVLNILKVAESLIDARAVYKAASFNCISEDTIGIDNVLLRSMILRTNLIHSSKVFPYILTIGGKLEEEAKSYGLLERFFLETIGDIALQEAVNYLESFLKERYEIRQLSCMNPGSLEDWPLTQQRQVFMLFQDVEKILRVKLTEHCYMIPRKSVSGVFFPTESKFYSCQICPRKRCDSRKANYSPELVKKYRV
ncbi:hypothetical protein [[Eubacterium] cellulosolvens]